MVTPYGRSINEREQAFFNAHGVEIPAFTAFECEHSHDIDKVTPGAIVERVLAHRAAIDDCDGVFVSCTALRAMETVEHLEAELDKPVVTSNASALWAALRRLNIDGSDVPAGRLYRSAVEADSGAGRLAGGVQGRHSPLATMANHLTREQLAGLKRDRYRGSVRIRDSDSARASRGWRPWNAISRTSRFGRVVSDT